VLPLPVAGLARGSHDVGPPWKPAADPQPGLGCPAAGGWRGGPRSRRGSPPAVCRGALCRGSLATRVCADRCVAGCPCSSGL